jgi:hypothetical protein
MKLRKVPCLSAVRKTTVLLGALTLLWAGSPARAQEFVSPWAKNLSFGVGADYSTGFYGADTRTNSVVVPVTVEWRPLEWLDLQVGVPYIYQSNTISPVYVVNPGPTQALSAADATQDPSQGTTQGREQAASQGKQAGAAPATNQGSGGVYQPGRTSSQNGIGDLSLQIGLTLVPEGDILPQFRALLYLKCPTGDRDNWLGSGEFDEGIGLAVSRSIGNLNLYLEGMWIFQGGSEFLVESGFTARDYLNYYAEVGYQVTDRLIPALALRGATPASDELGGTAEVRLKLAWKVTEHISLQTYVGTGLTTTSSDFSGGATLFYNF